MTGRGGIVDFAVAFPQGRLTVQEMHERSGVSVPEILEVTHCAEFPVLGEDEQAWELAVDAAGTALERTGTDPDDISRVIYAGAGYWDSPAWSPAAKVADELGVTGAHCFEVTNFCNAFTLGLRLAVDGLTPGAGERVLVVAAERFSGAVDRADPDSKALFNFGDAATAAVVAETDFSFAYLGSSARTDPKWCDYFVGDYHDTGVHTRRRGKRKGLADTYVENFTALTWETLKLVGKDLADVRYLLVNQNDKKVQERLLAGLDLGDDRSVFNQLNYGHMGCSDTLIALRGLADEGALADGDLVLLATSGAGFSWSVTALEHRAG
ncbi:3-oxoacyl-[acyl-carrier-protein] synthase III C-terminal domain-containing protein [Actinosynnema sp. NPDC047251]|uniref:Beta-ketoacyl synthase III n=1 Tax=Saccharothrix espanaensis (strain ATCC 51144 / DSM 44229 / JCM 9112 / NBRC 15066 / NRRL 15764) TaxID=1179773 RepID=K0JXJ3_SACES|nr:3-oxoacyl-[acyl-carrier-protein] synthase III C-terminal domain-containing protein [Saccharothrix espanaensis]CCH30846.1 Beta-ketoacyl synthase III [Saccharothrix espanaensis DSM 44229]